MRDYEQLGLFDDFLTEYKITKPIRLISFFSGIEAQFKALKYLGDTLHILVESYKTCEWAYNSIVACNSIHNRDFTDYSEGKTKEEMINRIRGISTDYNNPLTDEQLAKKPLKWIQTAYNCCIANHNLINIMNVKGEDLEIVDVDKYEYILTYSFPCQDLSLAGQRAGMDTSQAEGGTRSGLLWEVERILNECEKLPQILVMENVPQIHSDKDMPNFRKWIIALENMGYNNYFTDLNAKDYGIPQNRERCFMVSVLGREFNYKFPLPFKRELCLKDMLEDKVDEKYYLSQKMIDCLTGAEQKECKYDRTARFMSSLKMTNKDNIAGCITTLAGSRPTDNFIADEESYDALIQRGHSIQINKENSDIISPSYGRAALNETIEKHNKEIEDGTFIDAYNRSINNEIAGTITTRVSDANNTFIARYEQKTDIPLKRGYSISVKKESEELVDGVDVLGSYSKSNFNQTPVVGKQGIAPTFTENHGEVVAVLEEDKDSSFVAKKYKEYMDKNNGEIPEIFNPYNKTEITDVAPTQTTQAGSTTSSATILIRENTKDGYKEATEGDGVNISSRMHHQRGNVQKGMAQTLKTVCEVGVVEPDLRIRKITPKEAMRLMGFQDIDTDHVREVGAADASIFHMAGDSIVVTCLLGIFAKLCGLSHFETEKVIKDYIKTIKEK